MTELQDPAPERPACDDWDRRRADGMGRTSLGLGVAAWVIGGLAMVGLAGQAGKDPTERVGDDPARLSGYYAGQAMCALFPGALGLGACATGLLALRGRASSEGKVLAWIGLSTGAIYSLASCGAMGLLALGVQTWGSPSQPSRPPPTLDEARELADRLVETLGNGDSSVFVSRLDTDALLDRALEGRRTSSQERERFARGIRTAQAALGTELTRALARNGSYRLLRITPDRRAIVRLITDDGLNYHQFTLVRGADGRAMVADLHVMWGDQLMSESVGRTFQRTPEQLELCTRMLREVQAGDPSAALETWQRMPGSIRCDSDVLVVRVRAAQLLGGEDYTRTLAEVETALRGRPGLDLLLFDLSSERGDYDRCILAVDGMERTVQGDPYLDAVRAAVHTARGDREQALACARRAAEGAPELEQVWWTLLQAAVTSQAHEDTRAALEKLAAEFGQDPAELEQLDLDLAPFRASPEWSKWEDFKRRR